MLILIFINKNIVMKRRVRINEQQLKNIVLNIIKEEQTVYKIMIKHIVIVFYFLLQPITTF